MFNCFHRTLDLCLDQHHHPTMYCKMQSSNPACDIITILNSFPNTFRVDLSYNLTIDCLPTTEYEL